MKNNFFNNSYHLLHVFYVPESMLQVFHAQSQLIFTGSLKFETLNLHLNYQLFIQYVTTLPYFQLLSPLYIFSTLYQDQFYIALVGLAATSNQKLSFVIEKHKQILAPGLYFFFQM